MSQTLASLNLVTSGMAISAQLTYLRDLGRRGRTEIAPDALAEAFADQPDDATDLAPVARRLGTTVDTVIAHLIGQRQDDEQTFDATFEELRTA